MVHGACGRKVYPPCFVHVVYGGCFIPVIVIAILMLMLRIYICRVTIIFNLAKRGVTLSFQMFPPFLNSHW